MKDHARPIFRILSEEVMLKKLVDDYIKNKWMKERKDIGFYPAKEELLGFGTIMFFEPGTTRPKYVFRDKELNEPLPLPVTADPYGDFGVIYFDGDYSLTISDREGNYLAICTTREGFDLYA